MDNYTIAEDYTLPSKGLVYSKPVNPKVSLRSMTTEEEMKRLGHSDAPYKMLSEIIDDCLLEKLGLSAYDLCVGDFQYLLHKLRVVTYGKEYKINTLCPVCGALNKQTLDLDKLEVVEYSEDLNKYLNITLPKCGKQVQLQLQTPRMLDEIDSKVKSLQEKSDDIKGEPAFLFTLQSLIYKVDGQILDYVKMESFVRHLDMMDANYILKCADKLNIGIQQKLTCKCCKCKNEFKYPFPITGEFFGPSID